MHSRNHFTPFGAPALVPVVTDIRTRLKPAYSRAVGFWLICTVLAIVSIGHLAFHVVETARDLDNQYAVAERG